MVRTLSISLLTFCYFISAQADIYSASNALSRGDYKTAVSEFTRLAENGDANAQANLGYMYYAGEGVPQDYEKAVYWYRKAATQGNKDAQYNLAVSYAFGEGVKQDLTEAAIWYRRAGEQGHVVSQYSLGISYIYGEGVAQDQAEAARWFKKAADQGYSRAQVHLGSMYHTGEGVEQNYTEAVRWYRMAADRGDATAQYNLGTMYRSGKGVEQNYAQAKRWFRQSADQGYAAAQNELASLERTTAANIATRTVQAKPELPAIKETIAEVEPAKNAEPIAEPAKEIVAEKKSEPSKSDIQDSSVSPAPKVTDKKPLFTVEKDDLLSLDESQLDLSEPEIKTEPLTEIVEEVVDATEEITTVETTTAKPPIKKDVVITPRVYPEEVKAAELAALAETETVAETDVIEEAKNDEPGFFERLFASDKNNVEPTKGASSESVFDGEKVEAEPVDLSELWTTEESDNAETIAEEIAPEPVVKEDVVITPRVYPEEVKAAELAAQPETETVNETETIEEAKNDEPGFFDRLFANDKNNTEPTEDIADVTEGNPVTEEATSESIFGIEKVEAESVDLSELWRTEKNEQVETDAEEVVSEPSVKEEFVTTPRVYPEEVKAAEIAALVETETDTETIVESAEELTEPAEPSFFDRLFASDKKKAETTEDIADLAEEELEEEASSSESVFDGEKIEAEPVNLENVWATEEKVDEEIAEQESSDGLFSAIGNFFSNDEDNTTEATSLSETEVDSDDEIIIAKLEEKPAIEVVDLSQSIEIDLSQYSVQAGRRALTNNDYDEALKQFQPLATAGDSEAQAHLGSLYYVGKGVNKDLSQAYDWYKKSADQGNMDAQYSIGNMYLLGEGVEQNNAKAGEWYTLASNQGHVAAKDNLKSLEKLEALNQENQRKLDALAAEQEANKISSSIENNIEDDTTNSVETLAALEQPEILSIQETVETPQLSNIDDATTSSIDEIESEENIVTSDDNETESPSFFDRLFGSVDDETTDNLELEAADEIVSIDNEVIEADDSFTEVTDETFESESVDTYTEAVEGTVSDKAAAYQEDTEGVLAETEEEIKNEQDVALTEESLESKTEEESEGLFGFIGGIFSSEDESESEIEIIDSDSSEEVALLDQETELFSEAIDDDVTIEEFTEETIISEFDTLRPLATQGDQEAQYKLGSLYYSGVDVKQDYSQAALWYRRAGQQGNANAQFSLGNMFLMGEGVTQDDEQAAQWYSLAAEQGHISAKRNLDNLRKLNPATAEIEVETSNTGQLISLDDLSPSESTSIIDTTGKSEYEQGLAYAFGDGVAQNDRSAFNLFYEAADKGYVLAQYKVGVAYAYGEGVRQDHKLAAEWYRKAAEQGYTVAQRNLATMYLEGRGVEQNKVQALAWYQVVANAGNAMDIHRRDVLKTELTESELSESQSLSDQINSRIKTSSL